MEINLTLRYTLKMKKEKMQFKRRKVKRRQQVRRKMKKIQLMFGVKRMRLKKEGKRRKKKSRSQGELRLSHPISCLHLKRKKEKIPNLEASTSRSSA
jgi:hypothetical protein